MEMNVWKKNNGSFKKVNFFKGLFFFSNFLYLIDFYYRKMLHIQLPYGVKYDNEKMIKLAVPNNYKTDLSFLILYILIIRFLNRD